MTSLFKKVTALVLGVIISAVATAFVFAAQNTPPDLLELTFSMNNKKYVSSGTTKDLDVGPFIENGRTLVPFRTLFEELGYSVEWDGTYKKITGKKDGTTIEMWVDKTSANINGKETQLDVAPKINGGRTFVPLRFVSENSGAYAAWDPDKRAVYILKVNKLPANASFSPTGEKAFFPTPNGQYFFVNADGSNIIKIGSFNKIWWVDNSRIYAEKDKKLLINADGTQKDAINEWKYVGKTLDNKSLVLNGTMLTGVAGTEDFPIKDFNYKIKGIAAYTVLGPYLVALEDRDELLYFKSPYSTPVVVGKPSMMVNNQGQMGTKLFDTEVAFDDSGKFAAFYQYESGRMTLNVMDLNNPSDIKKAVISFDVNNNTVNPIKTKWSGKDIVNVESTVYSWSIKVGKILEVSESINSLGNYDFGTALLYTKEQGNDTSFLVTDGKTSKILAMPQKEVRNWYSFKGKMLATIHDKVSNKMTFVLFKGDNFEVLLDDFNIEETFEYNDNMLIHGYDRAQKENKLYRFDGENLVLVKGDFYVGKHVEYKGKLVINKYDKYRHYTLMVFDKKSDTPWVPKTLKEEFILDDFVVGESRLYMLGAEEKGSKKPIVAYDGFDDTKTQMYLEDNRMFRVTDLFEFRGELYGIADKTLFTISPEGAEIKKLLNLDAPGGIIFWVGYENKWEDSEITKINTDVGKIVADLDSTISNLLKIQKTRTLQPDELLKLINAQSRRAAINKYKLSYEINTFTIFNGKLYLGVSSKKASFSYVGTEKDDKDSTKTKRVPKYEVIESFSGNMVVSIDSKDVTMRPKLEKEKFNCLEFKNTPDYLYMLGEDDSADKDKILFICDGKSDLIPVRDVIKINNLQKVGNRVFIDVHDKNRITKAERDSVILFEGKTVRNVVVAHRTTQWDEVNGAFILGLKEIDIDMNKLCSYDSDFNQIAENFDINFWEKTEDSLFVCGRYRDKANYSLMRFTDANKVEIMQDFNAMDVVKLKNGFFMIYGIDADAKSPTYNQRVLYIYNSKDNSMTKVRSKIEILNMILL